MRSYYWRWLKMAFTPAFNAADWVGTAREILIPVLGGLSGIFVSWKLVDSWYPILLAGLFGGIFVVQFSTAPYRMFREDEAKRATERSDEKKRHDELVGELTGIKVLVAAGQNRQSKKATARH